MQEKREKSYDTSNTSSPFEKMIEVNEERLQRELNELEVLVEHNKNAKTKTKKNYIQKKIDVKKKLVLKYLFEKQILSAKRGHGR